MKPLAAVIVVLCVACGGAKTTAAPVAPAPVLSVTVAPSEPTPANDRDRDGIDDPHDKCPDVAEDQDGFEDDDGCPESR